MFTLRCCDYRIRISVHPPLTGLQECEESVVRVGGEFGESVRRVWGECGESVGRVWGEH